MLLPSSYRARTELLPSSYRAPTVSYTNIEFVTIMFVVDNNLIDNILAVEEGQARVQCQVKLFQLHAKDTIEL